ncbi:hypothetical protein Ancab_012490 [Ancistrocladus abbreviatus]
MVVLASWMVGPVVILVLQWRGGGNGTIVECRWGDLNLSEVQFIVLDEADQMLNVGFEEAVEVGDSDGSSGRWDNIVFYLIRLWLNLPPIAVDGSQWDMLRDMGSWVGLSHGFQVETKGVVPRRY